MAIIFTFLGISSTLLGSLTYIFFRRAERQATIATLEQVNALNESSTALLSSRKQLESLITSIKAGKQLKGLDSKGKLTRVDDNLVQKTKINTAATLQQAIYGTQEINRLESHARQVNAVTYSSDGKIVATASDDLTIKIWTEEGKLLHTLTGHNEKVTSVAIKSLPSLTATTTTSLRSNVGNSKTQRTLANNRYLLVSGSADKSLIFWEINYNKTKQITKEIAHKDWVTDLAFVEQQNKILIASSSRDGSIKLWNKEGQLINTLSAGQGWINTLKSFDAYLVSGSADGKIKIWELNSNKALKTITASPDSITSIAIDNDKKVIAFGTNYGEVKLLYIARLEEQWQIINSNIPVENNGVINKIRFSPDNRLIAVATERQINIYNRDGILRQSLTGHSSSVQDIQFQEQKSILNENSNQIKEQKYNLASVGADRTIRIWNIVRETATAEGGIYRIAASPIERNLFATAGFDGKIKIWLQNKTNNSKKLITTLSSDTTTIKTIKYSPNGKILASANTDNTLKLWDIQTGKLITTFKGHNAAINSIAFTDNGQYLGSGSEDKTIKIWHLESSQEVTTLQEHTDSVKTVTISPNNKYIVSGSYDNTIKIWNFQGKLLQSIDAHNLAIADLQFTPDGQTLISASWNNTIKLWEVKKSGIINLNRLQIIVGHQEGITDLLVSQNGKLLVSASKDRTIKLWNIQDGKLIKTLQGHVSQINSLAFVNNEQSIISADEQQGLYWWNLNLDNLLEKGCNEIKNYLQYNRNLAEGDRSICQDYFL